MEDPTSLVDSQICPFCECTVRKNCKNEQDMRILTQLRLSVPVKCTMTGKGCNWEGDISQFWDHVLVCEHFPRPCPYECDRNVFMPKKVLHAHLQDKCPMKNIPCEYQWAGCEVVLNRREMSKHMQEAAVLHNQLLAQTAKTYKTQITELQAEIVHLKEEVVVKKDVTESPPVKKRKVTFCQTPAIISDNKSFNVESSDEAIVDVETVKDEDNPQIREGDALTLPTQGLVSLIADNVSEGQIRLRKATDCVAEGIDTSATDIWRKRNPRKKRELEQIESPIVRYVHELGPSEKQCPPKSCKYQKADWRTVMIMCQSCETWYHSMCVKVLNCRARFLTEFVCPTCRGL